MSGRVFIDYTLQEYEETLSWLISEVKRRNPKWTSFQVDDFTVTLLELFAALHDIQSWYNRQALGECNLHTAKGWESLFWHARAKGYFPAGLVSSSTSVQVEAGDDGVTIEVGDRFSTEAIGKTPAVVFEVTEGVVIPAGVTKSVPVVQGETESEVVLGSSTGIARQTFTISEQKAVGSSVRVYVDDVEWTVVEDLLDYQMEDVCVVELWIVKKLRVRFGDGANGRIPLQGASIRCSYRKGVGESGNVGVGMITKALDNASEIESVTNSLSAKGGQNFETRESIRRNAITAARANRRIVTQEDFEMYAERYVHLDTGVGVAYARTFLVGSMVYLVVVASTGIVPTADFRAGLKTYLERYSLAGVNIGVFAPSLQEVDIVGDIWLCDGADPTILEDIGGALYNYLDPLYMDSGIYVNRFGREIFCSKIYEIVEAFEDVHHFNLTVPEADIYIANTVLPIPGAISLNVSTSTKLGKYMDVDTMRRIKGRSLDLED